MTQLPSPAAPESPPAPESNLQQIFWILEQQVSHTWNFHQELSNPIQTDVWKHLLLWYCGAVEIEVQNRNLTHASQSFDTIKQIIKLCVSFHLVVYSTPTTIFWDIAYFPCFTHFSGKIEWPQIVRSVNGYVRYEGAWIEEITKETTLSHFFLRIHFVYKLTIWMCINRQYVWNGN